MKVMHEGEGNVLLQQKDLFKKNMGLLLPVFFLFYYCVFSFIVFLKVFRCHIKWEITSNNIIQISSLVQSAFHAYFQNIL